MKSVSLISRRADLSREAFRDYYEHQHCLLAMRYLPFQRYVRNHLLGSEPEVDFDCLSEFEVAVGFRSQDVLDSPAGALLREDEQRFMKPRELVRTAAAVESLLFGPPRDAEHFVCNRQLLLFKRGDEAAPSFARRLAAHGAALGAAGSGVRRVTLDLFQAYPGVALGYDAMLSLWLEEGARAPESDWPAEVSMRVSSHESPPEQLAGLYVGPELEGAAGGS
ncbi:EthD domain-containing protein [Pseudomonas sp. LS44]|uniref:EthD domain-containing protein n=1 Tax=Pseudomonas sp. LS44 TaxID=1357074 RepID=UPI00215A81C0|nr:EthD domain-containing protein [Pseudomonas sp. LS44]UVE17406.1 EthD domain-containing protein [Pseudomonas sp. LS44]